MDEQNQQRDAPPPPPEPGQMRFLSPDFCRIHLGTHGALHVTVRGERIYGGVYAVYAFPVAYQDRYICLMHTVQGGEDFEIGLLRDLDEFPSDQADLVHQALRRRYFIHVITKIRRIRFAFGLLEMELDTDKGPATCLTPWKVDRAVDYGQRGKVLIDINENRYLIPDVEALSPRERREFQRYIYW